MAATHGGSEHGSARALRIRRRWLRATAALALPAALLAAVMVAAPAPPSFAQTVGAPIAVGEVTELGQAVAVDPATGVVFAGQPDSGTVEAVSEASQSAVASINVGGVGYQPAALAADPVSGTVYVTELYPPRVVVITEDPADPADDQMTGTVTVPQNTEGFSGPEGIAVLPGSSPDTGTVYVANGPGDTVSVVSEATNTVTAVIPIPAENGSDDSYPFGVTADPATGLVYVADQGDGDVSVISGSTLVGSFPLQATNPTYLDPTAIAADPDTGTVYVTVPAPAPTYTSAKVYVIQEDPSSPADATVAAAVPLPAAGYSGAPYGVPEAVAVNPAAASVYVTNYEGALDVISEDTADPAADTVTDAISLVPGDQDFDEVYAMAVDTSAGNPWSGTVYADSDQTEDLYPVAFPPAQQAQTISFTAPATGTAGGSAPLSATGGGSGNPVTFSVDPTSGTGVCSVSGTNGTTVSYQAAGDCVIDANQAGNASYTAAAQVQQTITVNPASQSISFTAPATGYAGGSATLSATGGGSGNPIVFSVDTNSGNGVCTVSGTNGTTVDYLATGDCVIDANQAGDAAYAAAPQVEQTITVNAAQSQTISFTTPATGAVGGSATLSATGGGSGNPVVFSVGTNSGNGVCSVSGDTVSYTATGSCVIDANQAAGGGYATAPQVSQMITVGAGLSVSMTGQPAWAYPGEPWSVTLVSASGGVGPYTWSLASGSLPPGLTLNADGSLSGTATFAGTYDFTEAVTDSESPPVTVTQAVSFTVWLQTPNDSPPGGYTGSPYSYQFSTGAGVAPYSWYLVAGTAPPPGLTLSSTGLLSGTPTEAGTYDFLLGVSDSQDPPATDTVNSVQVTIGAGTQSISFSAPTIGTVGGSATLSATGGGSGNPVVFSVDPSSGAGVCTVSGTNGTTVNYAAVGTCVIDANQAGNPEYQAAAPVTATIPVYQPTAFTSGASATFTAGTAGVFPVTATGSPTSPAITETGALPPGVTLTSNGNGSAALAGTPAAGSGGSYPIVLTAANGVTPAVTQAFVLTVDQPPGITSAGSAMATAGSPFSLVLSASGTPAPALTHSGALPAGITFAAGADGTATLVGIPAATAHGAYPITITAKSSAGTTSQAFLLTVDAAPAFTSSAAVTETAGTAFSYSVVATGFPAAALSTGTLPAGVSFTSTGNGTGTLAGTALVSAGTYTLTVTAGSASQTITLTVKAAGKTDQVPAFTSAATASATAGTAASFTVTTAGSPTSYASNVTRSGTLPAGVTFTNNGNGTASFSGTPTAAAGGNYPMTLTAKNAAGTTTQSFVLTVAATPAITTAATATAAAGSAFSTWVVATGSPAPAMTESGALPQGLTWTDHGNGTATLSGTPAAGQGGVYTLTLTATNSQGSVQQTFTLTVDQPPAITSAATASATHGQPFTFTFTTAGYPTASLTRTGTVPGLAFTSNASGTATLAGTPAKAGTYTLTVTAKNSAGTTIQIFTLVVN